MRWGAAVSLIGQTDQCQTEKRVIAGAARGLSETRMAGCDSSKQKNRIEPAQASGTTELGLCREKLLISLITGLRAIRYCVRNR